MDRKEFLKSIGFISVGTVALGSCTFDGTKSESGKSKKGGRPYPVYDLHTHTSDTQSLKDIVEKARKNGIELFGVLRNIKRTSANKGAIVTNDDLRAYYDETRDFPGYRGLQPMEIGWSKSLDPDLVAKADYVLTDPQIIKNSNRYGDESKAWEHDTYIDDPEEFMKINHQHYLDVINNPEPLDIFAWALYLPPCIARDYDRLWTERRQNEIIDALHERGCALEINDLARTPHPEFIMKAKRAGIKLTFGSDTRDHRTFRLDYCKKVADLCGLTYDDFYIPKRKER